MKLRNLSIASLLLVPTPAFSAIPVYVCEACPAGTWGDGTNCNTCSAGTYAYAGASSCSSCSSTNYGAWGGNCGTVTRNVTNYCTKAGSTSSTGNASTTTESKNMSCSGHAYCSATTNGTCISCSKPSNSTWDSTSGCGWSCNIGYGHSNSSCFACAIGYYKSSSGNTSCSQCPAGKYSSSAGSSSCSSCSSTNYGAWGGNCGTVTRNVTNYCTKVGSTSSTGNASTTTESKTMSCSGHTYCSAQTNGTCTSCSKPSNSSWASTSGCSWICDSGYSKSGNNCKLRIYAYFRSVNSCEGNEKDGYFSVTEYDYIKEMVDGTSYTYNGSDKGHDAIIFSSTNPGNHSEKTGCDPHVGSITSASTKLTPVREDDYLNLTNNCTNGSHSNGWCIWGEMTYTWTRK